MNFITQLAATETPGVVTVDVSWASDVLALIGIVSAIAGVVALWVRHEVNKNFKEIKSEFKPNGGGSLKDQVNRLETRHDDLDSKVDRIMELLLGKAIAHADTDEIIKIEEKDSK